MILSKWNMIPISSLISSQKIGEITRTYKNDREPITNPSGHLSMVFDAISVLCWLKLCRGNPEKDVQLNHFLNILLEKTSKIESCCIYIYIYIFMSQGGHWSLLISRAP